MLDSFNLFSILKTIHYPKAANEIILLHYELMDFKKCDVFQSISAFLFTAAQMIPSLVNGRLFNLAPESFGYDLRNLC